MGPDGSSESVVVVSHPEARKVAGPHLIPCHPWSTTLVLPPLGARLGGQVASKGVRLKPGRGDPA